MATWKAECWLGSSAGRQTLEVQANTLNGAKQQLERVYGAEQISNLREVKRGSESSSSSSDSSGAIWLIGAVFILGFVVTYWYIAIPIAVIIGILAYLGMRGD
jgi:hypothetical protein